jgi:hypothetical protein
MCSCLPPLLFLRICLSTHRLSEQVASSFPRGSPISQDLPAKAPEGAAGWILLRLHMEPPNSPPTQTTWSHRCLSTADLTPGWPRSPFSLLTSCRVQSHVRRAWQVPLCVVADRAQVPQASATSTGLSLTSTYNSFLNPQWKILNLLPVGNSFRQ